MTIYTVGPGKTYSTVAAAVAALPGGTFTTPQEIDIYWQSGGYDEVGGVVISGLTPTSSNPLIFRGMQAFDGTPGSQALVKDSGNDGTFRIVANVDYVQFINLEIDGGTALAIQDNSGGTSGNNLHIYQNCYLHNASNAGGVITPGGANQNYQIINCIIYNALTNRPYDSRGSNSVKLYNCFLGSAGGADLVVISDIESDIQNTYAFGGTTNTFWLGGAPTGNNNASSDSSATTLFSSSLATTSAASVITSEPTNWTQKTGTNALVGAGATLAAVPADIIGTTRTPPYDIGPWQRVSAPPASSGGGTRMMMGV